MSTPDELRECAAEFRKKAKALDAEADRIAADPTTHTARLVSADGLELEIEYGTKVPPSTIAREIKQGKIRTERLYNLVTKNTQEPFDDDDPPHVEFVYREVIK